LSSIIISDNSVKDSIISLESFILFSNSSFLIKASEVSRVIFLDKLNKSSFKFSKKSTASSSSNNSASFIALLIIKVDKLEVRISFIFEGKLWASSNIKIRAQEKYQGRPTA